MWLALYFSPLILFQDRPEWAWNLSLANQRLLRAGANKARREKQGKGVGVGGGRDRSEEGEPRPARALVRSFTPPWSSTSTRLTESLWLTEASLFLVVAGEHADKPREHLAGSESVPSTPVSPESLVHLTTTEGWGLGLPSLYQAPWDADAQPGLRSTALRLPRGICNGQ